METQDILLQIQKHPKFATLGFVQKERAYLAATWTKRVIDGLRSMPWMEARIMDVVKKHKLHTEFNGIILDVITGVK